MNVKVRRFIGFWSMLLLGLFLLFLQGRKYYYGEFLKYSLDQLTVEAVVTCVAIIMVLRPFALIELIETIFKLKNGCGDGKTDG